jgi:hypothetical protein
MARNGKDDVRARKEAAEQYRLAAEEALNQLDWCVNYLYRIRKSRIARVIEKNRSAIRREVKQ